MSKKLTTEEFVERARKVHGDKYDYSLVVYNGWRNKVHIKCNLCHNSYEIEARNILLYNCRYCNGNIKLTTDEFIKRAKKIHGDKYDYSLVEYKTIHTKVKIICSEHGIFEQTPKSHLRGSKCKKCKKITTEQFVENAIKIHGNKYDYSFVSYKTNTKKVNILCKKHNQIFNQMPNTHLNGGGCPICAKEIVGNKNRNNITETIQKANKTHNNKYDYSLIKNYKNGKRKEKIICPLHGIFIQSLSDHINNKNGCPICRESKGEREISIMLDNKNIKYIRNKRFKKCKNIKPLPFDFYLPEYNICIEFDGRQHFESIERWGGKKGLKERQNRDQIKNEYCSKNNIRLIRIRFDEDINEKLTFLID